MRLVDGRLRAHRPNASFLSSKKIRTKNFRTDIFSTKNVRTDGRANERKNSGRKNVDEKKIRRKCFDENFVDEIISGAWSAWLMIREHQKKKTTIVRRRRRRFFSPLTSLFPINFSQPNFQKDFHRYATSNL